MNMMQDPENEKKTVARVCASKQFPGKLHDLLTYAESSGFDWIISWVHNGKAFMVHSQQHLMQILPIFFGQTKFRSFQRQLNMWHFERVLVGPFKGAFMHPCFQRGNKALCAAMSRHHLPSSEMYQQAFALTSDSNNATDSSQPGTSAINNQYILNEKPVQLVKNRLSPELDPKALKWADWSERQELMKSIESAEGFDAKPHARDTSTNSTNPRNRSANGAIHVNPSYAATAPSQTASLPTREKSPNTCLLALDQEEDWSLLSDCLERLLHGDTSLTADPAKEGKKSAECSSSHTSTVNGYIPIDALAPGMDTPATPETIERLFAEFQQVEYIT